MHHGIATAIASNFLDRKRDGEEFPQQAQLAVFHNKQDRNDELIVDASKATDFQGLNYCVHFHCVNESQTPGGSCNMLLRRLLRGLSQEYS